MVIPTSIVIAFILSVFEYDSAYTFVYYIRKQIAKKVSEFRYRLI